MREGADRPGFIMMASGEDNHHVLSGKPTDRALGIGGHAVDGLGLGVPRLLVGLLPRLRGGRADPGAQRDAQAAILEVNRACVDAVQPGEPMHRIPAAAEAAFARLGMEVEVGAGRIGHGMGLMSTEPPHVAHYDATIMTPGLVFTIEPRFVNEHGIFNCEELVLVTERGGELLTTMARTLPDV